MSVRIALPSCEVRSWQAHDADALARCANSRAIWLNLRDAFPHPFTKHDADAYIRSVRKRSPQTAFAIAVNGEAVGSIAFKPQQDVERVSAEVGYFVAEPFWGRGIATEALVAVTNHAIETYGLTRLFAVPFAWNTASCRVLEKAGYSLEGRLRRSAIKDGVITDQLQYAFIAGDRPPLGNRD